MLIIIKNAIIILSIVTLLHITLEFIKYYYTKYFVIVKRKNMTYEQKLYYFYCNNYMLQMYIYIIIQFCVFNLKFKVNISLILI